MSELDELLSRPLADVADNGFSRHVMVRIYVEDRREAVVWMAVAICALAAVPFLPMREIAVALGEFLPLTIGAELARATSQFTASWAATLALVAVVLGFYLERQISRF